MSVTQPLALNADATLVDWLRQQARLRGSAVALRHKQRGIWHETTWSQASAEVGRLAARLAQQGFGAGERLLVISHPRPEALLLSLAAQALDGSAILLDPLASGASLRHLLAHAAPAYVFAEGQVEVDLVLATGARRLIIYADARGLAHYRQPALLAYQQALADEGPSPQAPRSSQRHAAFVFYRGTDSGAIEQQQLQHRELLLAGKQLVLGERLTAREQALAARALATDAQIRYLLAPWLLAGFCLNFPENLATRDIDRRELGPTLVAGTRETYGRLAELVFDRLPSPGSWLRRLIDYALQPQAPTWVRWLSVYPLRRPLSDVLGLRRARVPLLIGEPLPEPTRRLFVAIGVKVRAWPEGAHWQPSDVPSATPSVSPVGLLSTGVVQ